MNGIFIIAHAPLASALRECVLHVFPDAGGTVAALDVLPDMAPEQTLEQARQLMRQLGTPQTLILADLFGATPCNVASKLVDGVDSRLLTGVNLPMLLRAVSYRHEPLESLAGRAMMGASQGVVSVAGTAPQNQSRRTIHDQDQHDHQQ
jgi:mannose PTS system EIIA component